MQAYQKASVMNLHSNMTLTSVSGDHLGKTVCGAMQLLKWGRNLLKNLFKTMYLFTDMHATMR